MSSSVTPLPAHNWNCTETTVAHAFEACCKGFVGVRDAQNICSHRTGARCRELCDTLESIKWMDIKDLRRSTVQLKKDHALGRAAVAELEAMGLQEVSRTEALGDVMKLAAYLRGVCGLERGDRVCFFMDNGPEYMMLLAACWRCGLAACIREPRLEASELVGIINTCEPAMTLVEDRQREEIDMAVANAAEAVHPWVASLRAAGSKVKGTVAVDFEVFLAEGSAVLAKTSALGAIDALPDDIALLCTTSGTTGKPKAAMHSQEALFYLMLWGQDIMAPQRSGLRTVMGGRIPLPTDAGYISMIIVVLIAWGAGGELLFVERTHMRAILPKLSPVAAMMLPDTIDALHKKISKKLAAKPRFIGSLLKSAQASRLRLAWKNPGVADPNPGVRGFFARLGDFLVGAKLRKGLGGRLKFLGTGGQKLDPDVMRWFWGVGVPIYEMYASTEALVISMNLSENMLVNSAGATPTITIEPHASQLGLASFGQLAEVKLSEPDADGKGEVLVRGPLVMKGYYNQTDLTAKDLEDAAPGEKFGWFHTGDFAVWVPASRPDGTKLKFLRILGRKKRAVVLDQSGLPWVWPDGLEGLFRHSPYITECCVGFDGPAIFRPLVTDADVNPPFVVIVVVASAALLALPEADREAAVLESIDNLGEEKGLQPHEFPVRAVIVKEDFTQENGMRNANGKIVWTKVEERFSSLVIAAYRDPLTDFHLRRLRARHPEFIEGGKMESLGKNFDYAT